MKISPNYAIVMVMVFNTINQASGLAQGDRFEISGYLNMASYGENVSLQTDVSGGVNVFDYMNISATVNLGYRNYSLVTTDYLSVSLGKPIGAHEVRLGAIAGIYTLWFSGYQATVPCIGGEAFYSYTIKPGLSVRLKERVCNFSENHHNLFFTSTLVGLCFTFGHRANGHL